MPLFQRDETSTQQPPSLTNMFDPHIYGCQPFISGSTSNPTIQSASMINDGQLKNQTPTSSPQKNRHLISNTVIPIQSGSNTPQRKQSAHEDESQKEFIASNDDAQVGNNNTIASGSNSNENSRKTSTVSDYSSECTPDNTILASKLDNGEHHLQQQMHTNSPNIPVDQLQVKQSPARKLSRFLVSPTVIETANKELIVQEDASSQYSPVTSSQQQHQQQQYEGQQSLTNAELEMNINEETYQRLEQPPSESEMQPQQSIGFKMPETLEQLKIELENITHAHVSTKAKEAQLLHMQSLANSDATELQDIDSNVETSEAQVENSIEYTYTDPVGSAGDNTSVYNSRRTSADMNTNPTDLTSTASGIADEENLVNEVADDINIQKPVVQNETLV